MLKNFYLTGVKFPRATIATILVFTAFFGSQLDKLRWETDARVYLPKGHEAIIYDEKVDDAFGVRDTVIIGIENPDTVFNIETLTRIKRLSEKLAALPGVQATRSSDVASIATATRFTGDEKTIGSIPLMERLPQTQAEIDALKKLVFDNADLFVGNIVSADGKAAMVRAKLKEGMVNRWMTYWQVKGILGAETGEDSGGWSGNWGDGSGDWKKWQKEKKGDDGQWSEDQVKWWKQQQGETTETKAVEEKPVVEKSSETQWSEEQLKWWNSTKAKEEEEEEWAASEFSNSTAKNIKKAGPLSSDTSATQTPENVSAPKDIKDTFYLAGRPVIEVSSGTYALEDMQIMIPMVVAVMALVLLVMFRSGRGMLLPIVVMGFAIVWTMGLQTLFDVPLYTISTMLPVILVAVGIGDSVHLLSAYFDAVLKDPHRDSRLIVSEAVSRLGAPLIMTSLTTAIGFAALFFADMPPFRIFGVFAMIGIILSWLISIMFIPAVLTLMKPRVANFYARRRAQRVYEEQSRLSWLLIRIGEQVNERKSVLGAVLAVLVLVAGFGSSMLFVNSSWLSDFREDSDVYVATQKLNEKFSGTVFLNVVIESQQKDAFKDPELLRRIEGLQTFVAELPYVGDSLSVVNYLKNMNKSLHEDNPAYNKLPESRDLIAEYLFLFSVSGRPDQLDQVVDFDYKQGLVTIAIQTDYTKHLKHIIDEVKTYVAREFEGAGVSINYAGSANNSYIWADLLIGSQTSAIVFSKLVIFVVAALAFLSLIAGLYVVIPVTLSTLIVAGFAGLFSIPMDVSTALAAGIAIGVGVDYAVHYVYRYISERQQGLNHIDATAATLRTTGRTIVFNATVVSAGFAVLFLSQFPPHVKLGYFVTAYMLVSCLVALVVLPALFSYYRPGDKRGA
ncbi:MAG: MMPL family transporter [Gammaproteobacteria bacterium]|nr:MMPL family transporter [Gammaproteobacteria bacterium]